MNFSQPGPEVAATDELYRSWLLRHELPDAYPRWREAASDRAPTLAFTAIASDAKLLHRLGAAAGALAQQAERFAVHLMKAQEASGEARAAAQVVRARIVQWRQHSASRLALGNTRVAATKAAEEAAAPKILTLEEHLRIALNDHPHYRESTARALFRQTLQLGAAGLHVVGAPFDAAIMLATARYAARCWRGTIRGDVPSRDECMTAVALVQQWGASSGHNPFLIEFAGVPGSLEDLVFALCRDVVTCLTISSRFPEGALAPGFAMWEAAEEYLSFGVLSLRPSQLTHMDLDQARLFAAAAARLAASAEADPSVRLPVFPEALGAGGARRVLAATRFALPNGIEQRRSALAMPVPG
jgi:hypothetical protein